MSHTNTTTNYGLPQFLSSDKPAWMADINVAFADIDSQMKTNADAASAAQTTANDAVLNGAPGYSNLSTYAVGDVVNYLGRVYKCDIAVTTPEAFDSAKWSYYRLSDASAQLDVIDGEIGSTDISGIGDGTLSGAVSALNSNFSKNDASLRQDGTIVNQITPAIGTSVGLFYNYYYKVGRRVTFNIAVQNVPSYGVACTLPVGYRPYSSVYAGGVAGSVTINSNGEVLIPEGNTYCSIEFDAFN